MIEQAKRLNYGAILFFGRPEYYPQFGFKQAVAYGISDSEGYNYPAFMAMELKEGYLKDVCGGKYFESNIYDDELNRETVRAFDYVWQRGNEVKNETFYQAARIFVE